MKLWCLCIVGMLLGCNNIYAQMSLLEKKVTLTCTDKPIAIILEEIKQIYQIPFSFFNADTGLQQHMSISVIDAPLKEVLDVLFQESSIHYQAIGGQIVLKQSPPLKESTQKTQLEKTQAAKDNATAQRVNPDIHFVSKALVPASAIKENSKLVQQEYTSHTSANRNRKPIYTAHAGKAVKRAVNRREQERLNVDKTNFFRPKYSLSQALFQQNYQLLKPINLQEMLSKHTHEVNLPVAEKSYTASNLYVGILPGVGTHGIHPGEYVNKVSLNILAGYSAGNKLFEIGGLSNFNQFGVKGMQLSGIANVVGGNKFVGLAKQEKQKAKKELIESHLQGVQVAGLTNIIAGNVYGWQTAGGINIVQQSLQGVQVAGLSNLVETFSFGMQLAGISNASMESVDGVQVAGLYNYTEGELHGIQLSAFNQAGNIEGKHSKISVNYTGLQIGLLNTSKRMNGYQVGLVNITGEMAGTQIGLINFNTNKKINGTPIGLLNFNSKGHFLRLYTSELFIANTEISTGSTKIQNILSFGYNPSALVGKNSPRWSAGYSIGQVKRPTDKFFYSYDAGVSHINISGKLTKELSLLTKLRATAGYKVYLRKLIFHIFGGLTFNGYVTKGDKAPISPSYLLIHHQYHRRTVIELWPGFVAGIHI